MCRRDGVVESAAVAAELFGVSLRRLDMTAIHSLFKAHLSP